MNDQQENAAVLWGELWSKRRANLIALAEMGVLRNHPPNAVKTVVAVEFKRSVGGGGAVF